MNRGLYPAPDEEPPVSVSQTAASLPRADAPNMEWMGIDVSKTHIKVVVALAELKNPAHDLKVATWLQLSLNEYENEDRRSSLENHIRAAVRMEAENHLIEQGYSEEDMTAAVEAATIEVTWSEPTWFRIAEDDEEEEEVAEPLPELLPCPHCGGVAETHDDPFLGDSYYSIVCMECGAGDETMDKAEAIAIWNRRV